MFGRKKSHRFACKVKYHFYPAGLLEDNTGFFSQGSPKPLEALSGVCIYFILSRRPEPFRKAAKALLVMSEHSQVSSLNNRVLTKILIGLLTMQPGGC